MTFRIRLGPAGTPGKNTLDGVGKLVELGLQAMEVQFSHGIAMGLPLAKKIGEEARKHGIALSIHAPYYINLASDEKIKQRQSIKRILDSCERGHLMGAKYIVFHPAYFGKNMKEDVYQTTKENILDMVRTIEKKKWDVSLAPETTGKHSALGSLDETLKLSRETGCKFCIDFAHLYARNMGKIDYKEILGRLKKTGEKHFHFHFSNIRYSEKGELNHLVLDHSPDFRPLARELVKGKIDCTIISESPVTWKDSLKMKAVFEKIGYKQWK